MFFLKVKLFKKIYEIGAKYGIGVNHPSNFDELYDDYVLSKNRAQSVRIYTDFSAETQRLFSADIEQASPGVQLYVSLITICLVPTEQKEVSFKDFDKTSETVSFDLRRVCRLTHDYVFYLYKLYLGTVEESRFRQSI